MIMWHRKQTDAQKLFDVPATKVNEFRLLFKTDGPRSEIQARFKAEVRLLRDGRRMYERECLRNWRETGGTCKADAVPDGEMEASATARTRMGKIVGMSCTCTPDEAPRCVHVCAVCFRLFYRERYCSALHHKTIVPYEASHWVDYYLSDRLGSIINDEKKAKETAIGLEHIIGIDDEYQYQRWLDDTHSCLAYGNCLPSVEETTDMDTDHWPDPDAPDLTADLPHGWFTLLEGMYGKCQDKEKIARLYALYIARGELPEDAQYVDRLRWMLSTVKRNDGNAELLQATRHQFMAKLRVKYSHDSDGPSPTTHTNACYANTGRKRPSTNTAASPNSPRTSSCMHERCRANSSRLIGMRQSTVQSEQRLRLRENHGCAFADDCIHRHFANLLVVEVERSHRVGV